MSQIMKSVWVYLNYFRTVPVYLMINGCKFSQKCKKDIDAYSMYGYGRTCNLFLFSKLLLEEKSMRNVMLNRLHRNPIRFSLFWILFRPLDSLYINMPPESIGGGLSFQHGFSTIVAAKSIGENCRIYQQCTIGFNGDEAPIIEIGRAHV